MKRVTILSFLLALFAVCSMAQGNITVTGTVIDETTKEPLIGANIIVKGKPGLGVIADVNGKYTIKNIDTDAVLEVTYIGYEKEEVRVRGRKEINVKMHESKNSSLNEVIVTGLNVRTKKNITGAVTNVDVADLKVNPSASISNGLAGVVPGIQAMQSNGAPGATSEFWIRSISTFGANASALVLVDGFERNLDEINVEDIQSFTILKDASETAIYGSRGANGVVLITTKRGYDGKVTINGKVEGFYNTFTKSPDFVDSYTYASLANEARITRNEEPLYTDTELEMFRLHLDPDLYPDVDWQDLIMRKGAWTQRASLNISGGGLTARYFISGSYINQEGMYKTDSSMKDYNTNANYHRWNYRMNLDVSITPTTELQLGLGGSLSTKNDTGNGTWSLWNAIMGYNSLTCPVKYSTGEWATVTTSGSDTAYNPYVQATQTGYQENWDNNIQATLQLKQKLDFIAKGLDFEFRFGYDTYNTNWIKHFKHPELYRATPRFRDRNGNLQLTRIAQEQIMTQSSSSNGTRREFLEWQFNYFRTVLKDHNFGATLKYNQSSYIQTQNIGSSIENSIAKRNQGLAGRAEYNWKHRYYANFNFGYTGSENFHKDHRWGFFPAASFAWNISEEPFIQKLLPNVGMFKLRYSWGKVGNDQLGTRFPYLYSLGSTGGYNFGDYGYSRNYSGYKYSKLASTDVSWEVSTKQDLGIDFSFFQDAISGSIDYYTEHRRGIYMSRKYLPTFVGITSNPSANVGEVKARGFDGNIKFMHKFGDVLLTVRGNITYSKNEILERDEENTAYYYRMQEGHRVNQAMGYISLGLFKDYDDIRNSAYQGSNIMPGDIKYKDINGDGVINSDDEVAIGATTKPNLTYGTGISAQWKNFDINVHFQGVGKSTYFITGSTVHMFTNGDGGGNILSEFAYGNRWISHEISGTYDTEDPNAAYPRLKYGGGWGDNNMKNSTFWIRNGAYLRLKTLDIGYTISRDLARKLHCTNIRFSFTGTNLFTWSAFKLWDPEMGSGDGKSYPLQRTMSLGVSVTL